MGELSGDLRDMGYEPTEKESPFEDAGRLWTKGYELVCDETGIVISNEDDSSFLGEEQDDEGEDDRSDDVYRYRNSENVKLAGGHVSSYDWGRDEERNRFRY